MSLTSDGTLILPPPRGGPLTIVTPGGEGSGSREQWAWEPYDIAVADRALAADHEAQRGRYSEQRLGLYTAFAALPLLSEGPRREAVVARYVAWCNRWGSPGLFAFLFAAAGRRRGRFYVREKRSGRLLSEDEFFELYPEAELGDERYREPVRVAWLSREISLLRDVLTLCEHMQGAAVDEKDLSQARDALAKHLGPLPVTGPLGSHPDHRQGVYHARGDEELAHWLLVHSGGTRLAFSYNPRSGSHEAIWLFDSLLDALYHLLLEDVTAGQRIRRCADPKCGQFFRPKRDGVYHDERCRRRVAVERDTAKLRAALALYEQGAPLVAIADQVGWSTEKAELKLLRAGSEHGR